MRQYSSAYQWEKERSDEEKERKKKTKKKNLRIKRDKINIGEHSSMLC